MNGFYWIYLVMLGLTLLYENSGSKEKKRLIYVSGWAVLVLMFVLQDFSVSTDIAEYMRQYDIIPQLTFGEMLVHKFEIGYVLLCWVLDRVFESDRMLLVTMSLLILVPFAKSLEEETDNPMVALMAFLALGMYMHALIFWRQLAAMAILTWSYRYIRQRKLIPFLVTVLIAMTFHKVAMVFVVMYAVYHLPVNKWLLLLSAAASLLLGLFGRPIIRLGIRLIYPRYKTLPLEVIGGGTLLALLWVVTLLSYWVLRDRMEDPKVRLPFLMILMAATIQPVCFAYFWWLRIVLFFRVALVPMTAQLYEAIFGNPDNKIMALLARFTPRLHGALLPLYGKRWFRTAAQVLLFAVLFVWYVSELDGAVYRMAPIV